MQRGIVIILAVLMFIISCSEDEPTPIPTPQGLDCNDIYPEYDSLITEFEPTFEWCLINNGDKYRFQLSEEENFESFVFDTISESNFITPLYFEPHPTTPNVYFNKTLIWGTNYYWRVAAINNGVQQAWSDIYIFQTHDIRDDIVGTYQAQKTMYRVWNSHGFQTYFDSVYSTHQLLVEKIPDSRGIRVFDRIQQDFDIYFTTDLSNNYVWYQGESGVRFKIDTDSFALHKHCVSPPCTGYLYSGRE